MTVRSEKKTILVLGVGNILRSDDGVGVRVVEELQKHDLPPYVELLDGGTAGYDLLRFVEDREQVVIIDAVKGDQQPGAMFRFRPDDIENQPGAADSLHQIGFLEALQMAALMGRAPGDTVIIGVQPKTIDWSLSLSEPVASSIDRVVSAVLAEVWDDSKASNA